MFGSANASNQRRVPGLRFATQLYSEGQVIIRVQIIRDRVERMFGWSQVGRLLTINKVRVCVLVANKYLKGHKLLLGTLPFEHKLESLGMKDV